MNVYLFISIFSYPYLWYYLFTWLRSYDVVARQPCVKATTMQKSNSNWQIVLRWHAYNWVQTSIVISIAIVLNNNNSINNFKPHKHQISANVCLIHQTNNRWQIDRLIATTVYSKLFQYLLTEKTINFATEM